MSVIFPRNITLISAPLSFACFISTLLPYRQLNTPPTVPCIWTLLFVLKAPVAFDSLPLLLILHNIFLYFELDWSSTDVRVKSDENVLDHAWFSQCIYYRLYCNVRLHRHDVELCLQTPGLMIILQTYILPTTFVKFKLTVLDVEQVVKASKLTCT